MNKLLKNKLEELNEKVSDFEDDPKFPGMSYEQGIKDILNAIYLAEQNDFEQINELIKEFE